MRITSIIPSLKMGGAENVIVRLSDYWLSMGHDVEIVTFNAVNPDIMPKCKVIGLNSSAVKYKFLKLIIFIKRVILIIDYLCKRKPNLIIAFSESASFPACLAQLIINKSRLVISVRTDPCSMPMRSFRIPIRVLYRIPHHIVFPSNMMMNRFNKLFPIFRNKTKLEKIIRNPIPENFFQGIPDFSLRKKIILGCGRLGYEKGFDLLLRSFSISKFKHLYQLVILGDGQEKVSLTTLATSLGIGQSVIFLGFKEPSEYMKNASLFVLSSRYEGFPNALVEAMASGCPVVSFNCPTGPSEIILQYVNGILVAPGNIIKLAEAMDYMLSNNNESRRMSAMATSSMGNLRIRDIAPKWLELMGK